MDFLSNFLSAPIDFLSVYILPFVVVLSILVFVHEWGHYIVAKKCGVKVEKFSIGFGKEIYGWNDKSGTRWKLALLPLGGYVQMFGDNDPASATHSDENAKPLTEAEKKVAFYTQPVFKRASIVFAGPAVNFIFAILILTFMFTLQGQPYTPPVVSKLVEGSPAERAGILPDDKIVKMDGLEIKRFEDMSKYVAVHMDKTIEIELLHYVGDNKWSDSPTKVSITPEIIEQKDRFGFSGKKGRIGIIGLSKGFDVLHHNLFTAFVAANVEVWEICANTLTALGQIITGTRGSEELGGILRIGAYAGDFAKEGIISLIMFMSLLSVNLGLINLLPIPLLDGGHLMFYLFEIIKGKPIGERLQEYALRAGMAFIVTIMLISTWNDLVQLNIIDYVKKIIS